MTSRLLLSLIFSLTLFYSDAQDSVKFLALGDSYTIGESVAIAERWPIQLRDSLLNRGYPVAQPLIIAKTGWRTDELKDAIESRNISYDYDLVGLLIGVNNQYQGKSPESYKPEFEKLLAKAIALAGGDASKVFVISIPDYGYTPFGAKKQQEISAALDKYNAINKSLSEEAGAKYYYITDISRSRDASLTASDNLHPSGKQYSLWVERVLRDPAFFELFK